MEHAHAFYWDGGATMPANPRMRQLYERLAKVNIDRPFLKKIVLPEWWDDNMASTDAGYARGLGIISAHLGLDLGQLWDPKAHLELPDFGRTNFKLNSNVTVSDVRWSKCVALSAARFAAQTVRSEYRPLPSAKDIRDEILAAGADYVNLRALLAYLWEHGIPVLYVDAKPKGSKKMDGIAAKIDGRPVIVLSKRKHLDSLMLFNLAHEVGHILRGHVDAEPVLVDTKIDRSNDTDVQEREANESALEVLTGSPDLQFDHVNRYIDAESLADMAIRTGRNTRIDPGVAIQNFAYGRIRNGENPNILHALANKACTIIEGDKSPLGLIEQMLLKYVDFSQLADEDAEFLMNVAVRGEADAMAARQ